MALTNKQKRLFAIRSYYKKKAKPANYDSIIADRYASSLGTKYSLTKSEEQDVYRDTIHRMKNDPPFRSVLIDEFDTKK
jgi:hypothetical protein